MDNPIIVQKRAGEQPGFMINPIQRRQTYTIITAELIFATRLCTEKRISLPPYSICLIILKRRKKLKRLLDSIPLRTYVICCLYYRFNQQKCHVGKGYEGVSFLRNTPIMTKRKSHCGQEIYKKCVHGTKYRARI